MKKNFLALSVILATLFAFGDFVVHAQTRVGADAAQYEFNKGHTAAMVTHRLGDKVVAQTVHVLRAYYDYTVQGGAIGAVTLKDAATGGSAVLPKGAIVTDCAIDVVTAPSPAPSASPAPTLAIGTGQAANDLKAATASGSYTGLVACVPVGSVGTSIKLTADRTMSLTIATSAVGAGKIYVLVQYVLSDTL